MSEGLIRLITSMHPMSMMCLIRLSILRRGLNSLNLGIQISPIRLSIQEYIKFIDILTVMKC